MPTRIVREGILTSEKINSLPQLTELFYRRLMQVADDYGRYWASEIILRANCYQQRLNEVSESNVKQMLSECVAAGLIVIYGDGKYLEVQKFGQQRRSKSKFPQPTTSETLIKCKSTDKQMCSLVEGVVEVEDEGVGLKLFSDLEQRLSKMFNRKDGQAWSYSEQSTLSEISRRDGVLSELGELESFKSKDGSFFPQSISKLLSNWNETLDRARNFSNANNKSNPAQRIDRSIGTTNEGTASKYRGLGRVVKPSDQPGLPT